MTADDDARDPSATLTPEGLAAALWLLDNYELPRRTARIMREVFDIARASLAYDVEDLLADELPIDVDTDALDALLAPIVARRDAALDAYNAAVARLCALATGAKAGEEAGG